MSYQGQREDKPARRVVRPVRLSSRPLAAFLGRLGLKLVSVAMQWASSSASEEWTRAVARRRLLKGTSKNTPVNDGLAMDADVLWFRRGFVGAGSTFWAS